MRKAILLLGKDGQVGWELQRTLAPLGDVVALGREALDLTRYDVVRRHLRELQPEVIVNAAAYTQVDKAEDEPEVALAINGQAPGVLAEEAKRAGALLVHYSTDYVFDGTKQAPYAEDDPPSPLNVYGQTKRAGEEAIEAAGGRYWVLRTSWVYGRRGKNFLRTILRLLRERDELRVVDDQIGSPTWCRLIAEATAQMLVPYMRGRSAAETGTYHLTAGGQTSWYGFAKAILEHDPTPPDAVRLSPIPTSEYPLPAARPAYSVLANEKVQQTFGIKLPPWEHGLKLALAGDVEANG